MERVRSALVTGASRGIGRAVAIALATAGWRVFCVSTRAGGCDDTVAACTEAAEVATAATATAAGAAAGAPAQALACDVADAAAVTAMAEEVLGLSGQLDALVNNAGITRDALLMRMTPQDFDAVIAVNLRGAFLTSKAFARGMIKARQGRIVNIGSVVGVVGNAGQANYAASKAGLIGLTKSLAKELGGRGVTVNLVAPGFITTDMTAELPPDVQAAARENIPLGRFGAPQDIAAAVQFLCSDAASYITGQVLMVDGGMAM